MEQSNIDRTGFYEDMANILGEGYALTLAEIGQFMIHYGWGEDVSRHTIYTETLHPKTARALADLGVPLAEEKYKGTLILSDESIDSEETDIAESRARIDKSRHESGEKSLRSFKSQQAAKELSRQALRASMAS